MVKNTLIKAQKNGIVSYFTTMAWERMQKTFDGRKWSKLESDMPANSIDEKILPTEILAKKKELTEKLKTGEDTGVNLSTTKKVSKTKETAEMDKSILGEQITAPQAKKSAKKGKKQSGFIETTGGKKLTPKKIKK